MNKIIIYYLAIIVIIVVAILNGCKKEEVPVITTTAVSNITATTAKSGGNITSEGSSTVTSRGVCWSTGTTPIISDSKTTDRAGAGSFTSNIVDLFGGTTYFLRAYATNDAGTGYGMAMSFNTLGQKPTALTQPACCISFTTAKLNGTVNANYILTDITFEYGTTTSYGNSVSATPSPVTGNNTTSISVNISDLNPGTTYHFRIKAVNPLGITYGNDMICTTLEKPTDIDGNAYNAVAIGSQIWMTENLKTTKYRNGDLIGTTIPTNLDLLDETSPKYQWAYNGNENLVSTYGRLYTWHVIEDDRGLCPSGWHVPTDGEWKELEIFIGMAQNQVDLLLYNRGTDEGSKLKESGTSHWLDPNNGATNYYNFTALPGGYRYINGNFVFIGETGMWWSSTPYSTSSVAWYRYLNYQHITVGRYRDSKKDGMSVRCLKD